MVPPPLTPEEVQADLFIATHDHMDHLDPASVPLMDKKHMKYAGPASCLTHFQSLGIGSESLLPLDRGKTLHWGDIAITGVYADHTADSIGVAIEYQGKTLYFTGDTLYSDRLGEGLSVDVLGNMAVEEAIELTEELHPKVGVPNHYGMFAANTADPQVYLQGVAALGVKGYEAKLNEEFVIEELLA